jgi:hypothetical protein
LPPVQQGRELNSLDSAGNSETEKQPVEMCFHSSARHLELTRNFGIVTTLQEQFYDLLFARTQPNGLFLHQFPLNSGIPDRHGAHECGAAETFPEFIASTMPL